MFSASHHLPNTTVNTHQETHNNTLMARFYAYSIREQTREGKNLRPQVTCKSWITQTQKPKKNQKDEYWSCAALVHSPLLLNNIVENVMLSTYGGIFPFMNLILFITKSHDLPLRAM